MKRYTKPILTTLYLNIECGFGASQGSPSFDIGIGGWDSDENEYYN